jgi:hypothetical protein
MSYSAEDVILLPAFLPGQRETTYVCMIRTNYCAGILVDVLSHRFGLNIISDFPFHFFIFAKIFMKHTSFCSSPLVEVYPHPTPFTRQRHICSCTDNLPVSCNNVTCNIINVAAHATDALLTV